MRGKKTIALILGLISTLAWFGCTSKPIARTDGAEGTAGRECFDRGRVRAFVPLDERSVYVRALGDEHYLLTIDRVDPSIHFATGITISNTVRTVCSDSGAVLTYTGSGGPVSSRIVRVESVDSKEAARALAKERNGWSPNR